MKRFTEHLSSKADIKPKHLSNPTKGNIKILDRHYLVGDVSSHPTYPERIKRIESIAKNEHLD